MASSLYNSIMNDQYQSGGFSRRNTNAGNTLSQMAQFRKQLRGRNPKDIVENMLRSGEMTKEQFDEYSSIANSILNGGG